MLLQNHVACVAGISGEGGRGVTAGEKWGTGGSLPFLLCHLCLLRSLKTRLLSANITKVRSTHIELGIKREGKHVKGHVYI